MKFLIESGFDYKKMQSVDLSFVPRVMNVEILTLAHNDATGGHLGVKKTVQKKRQHFYWVNIHSDVSGWVNSFPVCCARKNSPKGNKAEMENITVGEPLERVAMDITGPFPTFKYGNKYVLVLMDYFTK